MSIEVTLDLAPLEAMASKAEGLQEEFTQRVMRDTDPYVPKDTGTMAASAHLTGRDQFTYEPYYSIFVYDGTRYMAAREWFEPSKADNLESWEQFVAQSILSEL